MEKVERQQEESEKLKEIGKEIDRKLIQAKQRVNDAYETLQRTESRLEAAMKKDENGNYVGNVAAAQQLVKKAQNLYRQSQSQLRDTEFQKKMNIQEKQHLISRLDNNNVPAQKDLEQARKMAQLPFAGNAARLYQITAQTINQRTKIKLDLHKSMGLDGGYDLIDEQLIVNESLQDSYNHSGYSYEGTEVDRSFKRYQNDLFNYMCQHNYGSQHYEIYSKDPEWKALHKRVFDEQYAMTYDMPDSYQTDEFHFLADGKHHKKFLDYYKNFDGYEFQPYPYSIKRYVLPDDIEGITMYDSEASSPVRFWSQHETGGTLDSFIKTMTIHYPDVKERIESGESLSSIYQDDVLQKCARVYYENLEMVKVREVNGFYEVMGGGRHRILAARRMGYDMPVEIVGRCVRKSDKW